MKTKLQTILNSLIDRFHPTWDGVEEVELNGRYGPFGELPLHTFACRGDYEACQKLIKAGSELDVQGEHGFTPLVEAAQQGHPDVVRLLLASGANPNIPCDSEFGTLREMVTRCAEDGKQDFLEILTMLDTTEKQ